MNSQPPHIFLRFFRWFCHPELKASIEGDLMELYRTRVREFGKWKADKKFIGDVLLLFRPGIIKSLKPVYTNNQSDMLNNYFKIAVRILLRNKGYSFINISGLAVGMASAMLILLWVQNEVSYDRFYPKADRIYQLFSRDMNNGRIDVWGNTPALMAPELQQTFPEVEDAVRYRMVFFLLKSKDDRFNEGGAFADPNFLSLFEFPILKGKASALKNDFGIALTKRMAIKLFGTIDCLDKPVIVNDTDHFTVTAVLDDRPNNTEFQFEYLLPWTYIDRLGWSRNQSWANTNAGTYVLLKEGSSSTFASKVMNIVKSHVPEGDGSTREILSHPLTKVHLYSRAENGELTTGRIQTVKLFTAIAVLIILIACINFMNLSTARSEKRAQEVGVRKIVGAHRSSLVAQFISEGVIMVIIAFAFALVLVQFSLNPFNQLIGTSLRIEYGNPQFWQLSVTLIFLTGLLAGSYPAFYLSSSPPLKVLKGTFRKMNAFITPRKVLVILQFTFAIVLSICAITVRQQIQFALERDAGYDRSGVAYNFMQGEIPIHYDAIKNELLASGAAVGVTRTYSPVTRIWNTTTGLAWQGSGEEDKKTNFLLFGTDVDMVKTFGVKITQGRDIDTKTFQSDTAAVLLNETAVDIMRLKNPVGEVIKDDQGQAWTVVGVIKDFIIESPYDPVKPMIIDGWTNRYGVVNFRLNPALSQKEGLAKTEAIFKKYNPEYPFEYYFADEFYNRKLSNEKQTGTLAALFAGLTIFISCLGLFGLAAYMAETKTKEIGVRKVLGASATTITVLLSKEFVKLVIIAIFIASPLAWFATSSWLQSFNYRVPVGVWVFLNAGIVSIAIAALTISFQSIKAAMANPVDSLKSE